MPGRFRIIGPPGTGKTTYGLRVVEDALAKGISPYRVLYSSYTKVATTESRDRALQKFDQYGEDDFPLFRTCHSIALRLLGGKEQNPLFTGYHQARFGRKWNYSFSSQDSLGMHGDDIEVVDRVMGTADDYLEGFVEYQKNSMISNTVEALNSYQHLHSGALPTTLNERAVTEYQTRRQKYIEENELYGDFSDLLRGVLELDIHPQTDLMIVDECQDNSKLMATVFERWADHCKGDVYYLGDPNQCLFEWSGAAPEVFTTMKVNAQMVLSQSYRVPKKHHRLAMSVIRQNGDYIGEYHPTSKEGTVIRTPWVSWKDLVGKGDIFFLCRTRYLLRLQFDELIRRGIPFYTARGRKSPLQEPESVAVNTFYKLLDGDPVSILELHYAIDQYLPAKPYLKHKKKTEIKVLADTDPTRIVRWRDLPGLGFTEEFTSQGKDFINLLKMTKEYRSYFETLVGKYGREALVKSPELLLSTPHGVKGMQSVSTVFNRAVTKKVIDGYHYNPKPENRVGYVGLTRATDNLVLLDSDRYYEWPV